MGPGDGVHVPFPQMGTRCDAVVDGHRPPDQPAGAGGRATADGHGPRYPPGHRRERFGQWWPHRHDGRPGPCHADRFDDCAICDVSEVLAAWLRAERTGSSS
eukprot:5780824-Pyramimonas_sp.AAC.1